MAGEHVYIYKVINSEGDCIDRIILGCKNQQYASDKLKAKYGKNACFLKLVYSGMTAKLEVRK